MKYIGIDIGGSWLKGTCIDHLQMNNIVSLSPSAIDIKKIKSPLNSQNTGGNILASLIELIAQFDIADDQIASIGIATAGIVNYHGTQIVNTSSHLKGLKCKDWKPALEHKFQCPVTLINDADAAAIGLSMLGTLKGNKTIGIISIGTGVGFSIWKNSRRWQPGKILPLLGDIKCANSSYNNIASASKLASIDINNNLINVLNKATFKHEREAYLKNVLHIIETATVLYGLDEVIVCGGLVDAAVAADFDLEKVFSMNFNAAINVLNKTTKLKVAPIGNKLQLMGAIGLAEGNLIATKNRLIYTYKSLDTEIPHKIDFHPEKMESLEIIEALWEAELEASQHLKKSLAAISSVVELSIPRIEQGGRIIYVGAGTSGRIAAMDAVEIPCTFGFPAERILTLISGGLSDAAIEIESNFEEDASAIPEMLFLNIQSSDVIIGISASGSAYYVQSALAYAKSKNALSVMIQAKNPDITSNFCDHLICLNSGREIIAGSTRMKAGTATKKVLNFFSKTLMIKLEKVMGSYMVDVVCTNDKLISRAQKILKEFYNMDAEIALEHLYEADMHLGKVIKKINKTI